MTTRVAPSVSVIRAGATVMALVAALLLGLTAPEPLGPVSVRAAAADTWTQLRSPHFVLVGDASEREIRNVAARLEGLQSVLARAWPAIQASPPVPTVAIVFANDRSFAPYRLTSDADGYFVAGDDVNYIVVTAQAKNDAYESILFDYTSFLVENAFSRVPLWVSAGLGEFYSTFDVRANGRTGVVGQPAPENVRHLHSSFITLDELVAIDRSSPIYREGRRRGIFFAESWALVHYLLTEPRRVGQLPVYLSRVAAGESSDTAFAASFKSDSKTLQTELSAYLRAASFSAGQVALDDGLMGADVRPPSVLGTADARAHLGLLLGLTGRAAQGRTQLDQIVRESPNTARAWSAMGSLELRAGHLVDALPHFERAADLAPEDALIQGAYGQALAEEARQTTANPGARTATLQKARDVLAKAVTLRPASARSLYELGTVELERGGDPARARMALDEAVRLAPARQVYAVVLGDAMIRVREYDRATAWLTPLTVTGERPEIRDAARALLGAVAQARQREAAAGTSGTAPAPPQGAAPSPRFALRDVKPDETRITVQFEAVECGSGAAVIVVSADGRVMRFANARLDDIEFVSYRPDQVTAIGCGPMRPPKRALVTYRANSALAGPFGAAGEVIRVELVPDGYTPPT